MQKEKIGFEIILLFFVALLGGIISTIVYRLEFSVKLLSLMAVLIFAVIIAITFLWDIHYASHKRGKDISDKKETRNNTREILRKLNNEK